MLKDKYKIGVMEADIEATVDAEKIEKAGVKSIQVNTNGQCAMDAEMTLQAMEKFQTEELELLLPEGDDKPLKYPLMFQVCDVVLINKIDTREYFSFNDEAVKERIHKRNPDAKIFFVSAKTGEGFEEWIHWLESEIEKQIA